jgi:hypothetical protein
VQPAADHSRISTKMSPPCAVAEDDHTRRARHIVLGAQQPAKRGARAEHVEEVPRDARLRENERPVAFSDRVGDGTPVYDARDGMQCPAVAPQPLHVVGHQCDLGTRARRPESDDAVRRTYRERPA